MIFNSFLTKYLIRKGVSNKSIFVTNTIILTIIYSILYRFFYLRFEYVSIQIALAILAVLFFVFTLLQVNSMNKRTKNI